MELYIVDAFTTQKFSGNQAGVAVLSGDFPDDVFMQNLAAELKHSETAYIKQLGPNSFQIRYFTPQGEVDLCGHATIASFTVLREKGIIGPGTCSLSALAGQLGIEVSPDAVWMDMAPPVKGKTFSNAEAAELYAAYGLSLADMPEGMSPWIVSTGLCDIILPVSTQSALDRAVQNESEVTRLSKKYEAVGVHMFWPRLEGGVTAHCRNFAPLYAIPEEAATGTANGALTYYLYCHGKVHAGEVNRFIQGESMGKPSEVLSRLSEENGGANIRVGGGAVITLQARLL